MKYTVKFYPEKRKGITEDVPVMLSVTYSGKRMTYYTGKRCNINQWDLGQDKNNPDYSLNRLKRNQVTPSGETSTDFNRDLDRIKTAVSELFHVYEVSKNIPSPAQLRDDLKAKLGKEVKKPEETGFFDRYKQYLNDGLFRPNRKKKLQTTLNKLEAWRPKTTFEDMTVQYVTDFQKHLISEHGLSRNAAISELKCLRAFLNYSIKHGWNTNYPFNSFSIEAEAYGDPVFITVEERDLLFVAVIQNEKLARVRDLFVFQCLIGCRVSDLTKLKKQNIINGCVEYIAGKTKDNKPRVARVPLTEKAKTILSKYDLPNGDLLPYIADQRYNDYIKELFALVGLTRMVTIPDPKTRANIQKPLNELASSHMARRVFVGSLYSKGVKNEIIGSMSGHVDGSKAFARYYNIDIKDQQAAVNLIE
ncbi:MAG: tyrosine-type recombinase/integrase [Mangrovibacterium sp.]